MLKINNKEKQVLDLLLTNEPGLVAQKMKISRAEVYDIKYNFRRKVQNAREFLQVANSVYKPHLARRINTPGIMPGPDEEPLEIEKHSLAEEMEPRQTSRKR